MVGDCQQFLLAPPTFYFQRLQASPSPSASVLICLVKEFWPFYLLKKRWLPPLPPLLLSPDLVSIPRDLVWSLHPTSQCWCCFQLISHERSLQTSHFGLGSVTLVTIDKTLEAPLLSNFFLLIYRLQHLLESEAFLSYLGCQGKENIEIPLEIKTSSCSWLERQASWESSNGTTQVRANTL